MGGGTSPVVRQQGFRGRGDTVGINSTTWDYNENTNFSWDVDTTLRVRILISDTVTSTKTTNYNGVQLQFDLESAGLTTVTDTTAIQYTTSSQFTDADAVTSSQITGGQNTFTNGEGDTNNTLNTITLGTAANGHTEIEFCITIDSAQVNDGDQFTLEVSGMDTTATQIPTITIVKAGASFQAAWAKNANQVIGA